jgi:16S rRNA (adenine1518-N6/adenine1519-N6)-dimethyltransferase
MPQSKSEIQSLLSLAGTEPRHRFGQNFMIDKNLVRAVADAGEVTGDDVVIEVGPGTGTLSDELLERGGEVVAVEIDRDLAAMLRHRLADQPRFTLIEADALAGKHELAAPLLEAIAAARSRGRVVKLVANLPYNIASPLIIELLLAGVELLAFTVQKEVAERLKAPAGGEDFGPLTVMAQTLADVEVLRTLPPQAFWPAPKIDSSLVRMRRRRDVPADVVAFGVFVRTLFGFRRKTLRKALAQAKLAAETILARTGIDPLRRPETLGLAELRSLFDASRST